MYICFKIEAGAGGAGRGRELLEEGVTCARYAYDSFAPSQEVLLWKGHPGAQTHSSKANDHC